MVFPSLTTTRECCLTCACDASKQHWPHFNRYANTPPLPTPSPAFPALRDEAYNIHRPDRKHTMSINIIVQLLSDNT